MCLDLLLFSHDKLCWHYSSKNCVQVSYMHDRLPSKVFHKIWALSAGYVIIIYSVNDTMLIARFVGPLCVDILTISAVCWVSLLSCLSSSNFRSCSLSSFRRCCNLSCSTLFSCNSLQRLLSFSVYFLKAIWADWLRVSRLFPWIAEKQSVSTWQLIHDNKFSWELKKVFSHHNTWV